LQESRKVDTDGLLEAVERTVQFGEPFDVADFVKVSSSTPFRTRKMTPAELEERSARMSAIRRGGVRMLRSEDLAAIADAVADRLAPRDDRPLLSQRQVAERLGVSERTVRDLLASGELRSFKVRGTRKVHPVDVDALIGRARG
jgi:excisionase family DNA binding protein